MKVLRLSCVPLAAFLSLGPACFSSTSGGSSAESEESSDSGADGADTNSSESMTDGGSDSTTETDSGMDSNDGDMTETGTESGDALCDDVAGQVCLSIPADWDGPMVLADGAEECGDLYSTDEGQLFSGLQGGDASCECNCGNPTVSCSESMNYIGYSGLNCVNGQGQVPIAENECENTFSASHAVSLGSATTTCGDGAVVADIDEPTWGETVRLCAADELGGMCDDGGCFPDPSGAVCISREGDHDCPAGFDDKTSLYSGYDDGRECPDSCSCTGGGGSCTVSVTGYASTNCSSPSGAKSVDSGGNTCVATNSAAVKSIRPGNVSVKNGGTCTPGAAALGGSLDETGQTTVCCAP